MSIGNRVWLDDSADPAQWAAGGSRNNGELDATDDGDLTAAGVQNPGIAGVDLELYADDNLSGVVDVGDTLLATTTTDAQGYYLFDGLSAGAYLVRIPASEFAAGAPLAGLVSSHDPTAQPSPTDDTDSDDNGTDSTAPATDGVDSTQILLVDGGEATTEADLAPPGTPTVSPGPDSRGINGEADADSDLTIDFGFVRPPMSVGNRVWLDEHPTTQSLRGNALDAGESAIAGVEVALYRDLDADGAVDAGEDTTLRDTSDVNGYYLFDNLPAGNYLIVVTAANFNAGGPLENLISSHSAAPNPIAADNGADRNDNGRDAAVAGVGILSSRIALAAGAEPIVESPANSGGDGPSGRGTHGERDSDSDLTVDFGFFVPHSFGNRVWLDDSDDPSAWATTRDDGVLDPSDDDLDNPNIAGVQGLGVAGVSVRLYRDLDQDGVVDAGEDSGLTTLTDAAGYFRFAGLPRGSYLASIEASNFTSGRPLAGFRSSTDSATPADDDTDGVDDGVGATPDPMYGVLSPSIALGYTSATVGTEPIGETDPNPQTQTDRGPNGERDAFSNLTVDFGFARTLSNASLGDRVWRDTDGDGIQDTGEPGIAGVQLTITGPGGATALDVYGDPMGIATTGPTGEYRFDLLATLSAGSHYTVTVDPTSAALASLVPTVAGAGPASVDSSTSPAASGDLDVAGVVDLTLDFGYVLAEADLGVVGSYVSIDPVARTISWSVTIVNNGPQPSAAGRSVSITLSPGLTFVSGGGFGIPCALASGVVQCDLPALASVGSGSFAMVTSYVPGTTAAALDITVDGGIVDLNATNDGARVSAPSAALDASAGPVALTGVDLVPIALTGVGALLLGAVGLAVAQLRRRAAA